MKKILRNIWPDAAAIAGFVAIVVVYFFTPLSEGLSLSGHDNTAGIGANHELSEYNKTNDEPTYWTNALFGGMPTYQLAPSYPTTDHLFTVQKALGLWMPQLLTYVFLMLLGFYIMLRAFDFRAWMAALGAVVWAFSSYFFIIIAAGHLWKVYALAYLPALIGGIVLCLRGRLAVGFLITAIFSALEIVSNHPQMTYYFLPVIAVVTGCVACQEYKALTLNNSLKPLNNLSPLKAITLRLTTALAAGLIGVCINLTSLYHTYEYSRHTMRGGSELTQYDASEGTSTDGGLDRAYITQWSYGIDETWSLLVPKINGGSSMDRLNDDEVAMRKADRQYRSIYQSLPQYFGDQPFTAGPVYVGAIVLMLAILALVICRGPLKWGLLALTLLSIALSWGHNWQWLTDLFIDHVPLYSKFRTVSSILVVAEFTIPLLAILALKELVRLKTQEHNAILRPVLIVGCATAAVAALIALSPDTFVTRFVSNQEHNMLTNAAAAGYIPQEMLPAIFDNITDMRKAVVSHDAWRSLIFIIAALAALLLFAVNKIKPQALTIVLLALCITDMWTVNKRYLNDSMFSKPHNIKESFAKTPVDEYIMQDDALDYRVLNMASDTFNENETSYWHKSVGGYSAVKMQRYQDLINYHIRPEMNNVYDAVSQQAEDSLHGTYEVINMLNTRWFILPAKDNQRFPLRNPYAFGNAWFVTDIYKAANADDEIGALDKVNLRTTAIISQADAETLQPSTTNVHIELTDYQPNALTYKVEGDGGLAVFSEIYYPGWRATLDDGTELPVMRANYTLRAVSIPAGSHTLTMRFDPQTIHVTETIAWTAWALLGLLMIGIILTNLKSLKRP